MGAARLEVTGRAGRVLARAPPGDLLYGSRVAAEAVVPPSPLMQGRSAEYCPEAFWHIGFVGSGSPGCW